MSRCPTSFTSRARSSKVRPRVAPSTHVHNVGSIEGSRRSLFHRFDPILTSVVPFLSIVSAVKTADRTGLLLDISDFFQRNKYSIIEAEVSTTTHDSMASDIFLVQQADGRKIQKPRQFAEEIRDVILKSNRAHRSNSTTPGTSRSSSRAPSRDPSAHGGSQFYSRDGGGIQRRAGARSHQTSNRELGATRRRKEHRRRWETRRRRGHERRVHERQRHQRGGGYRE